MKRVRYGPSQTYDVPGPKAVYHENVSAGGGKTVGVRCAPSPIATMRREIR
jgi:hypothetical protein